MRDDSPENLRFKINIAAIIATRTGKAKLTITATVTKLAVSSGLS